MSRASFVCSGGQFVSDKWGNRKESNDSRWLKMVAARVFRKHDCTADGGHPVALGNPERESKSIHIAWTNGKRVHSQWWSRPLRRRMDQTFTPPHMDSIRERIQLDRRSGRRAVLASRIGGKWDSGAPPTGRVGSFNYFEILTADDVCHLSTGPSTLRLLKWGLEVCWIIRTFTIHSSVSLRRLGWPSRRYWSTVKEITAQKQAY